MANLDSSWQDAVVKLAQAGNLQAIAFWMNHYLVPQGICVQAMTDQPGHLQLRVMCRRLPDRDRLVRFICHRLCKLDSDVIRSVHITAQQVGSTHILWEKSAKIAPLPVSPARGEMRTEEKVPVLSQAQSTSTLEPATLSASAKNHSSANPPTEHSVPSTLPPISFAQVKANSAADRPAPTWTKTALQQVTALPAQIGRSARKSLRWFVQQPPRNQALMLGSSAIVAFLMGCSYEFLSFHTVALTDKLFETATQDAPGTTYAGTVKTSLASVRVIQQPVTNPADTAITLLFSHPIALSQTTPLATLVSASTQVPSNTPVTTTVTSDAPVSGDSGNAAPADMVITSLETPLSDRPTAAPTPTAQAVQTQITKPPDQTSASDAAELAHPEPTLEPQSEEPSDSPPKPSIVLPEMSLKQLQTNSVNVVNLASDRLSQTGITPVADALKHLQQNRIYPIGAGETPETARRPQIFLVKGKRIAYLGYSAKNSQSAGADGQNAPTNEELQADIKSIRDQVDWVIVSYHWNQDLRAYPEEWQTNIAHAAIDHGADLVVGYHPAVTQGTEIYGGRAIVYSLGTTLDEYQEMPDGEFDTAAVKVTLKDKQMQVELLPVQVRQGRTEIATGEARTAILDSLQQASSLFRQPLRSPTTLDATVRLSLPAAPDSDKPFTDPFISYPDPQTSRP
ncbi:MAG TPA: CapA family protein [Trichocoleus sp.]